MRINFKRYPALFIAIGLGFIIALILIKSKDTMQHDTANIATKSVETIVATYIPFRTRITAYGNVEPAITLNGMAEVSGKISFLHPNLKPGETIPGGTQIIRIEAKDYTVGLKKTEADLSASHSSLKELIENEKSTKRSLTLAKKNLTVGEAEYARIKQIWEQRVISKSTLDAEEQKVLQLRQQVEELQGTINTYDSRKQSVKSQIARAEQEVKNSETILGRTEITLPFDARIGSVNIEKNEFVSVGTIMFEAIDLKGVEINAHLAMDSMRKLVTHLQKTPDAGQQIAHGGRINDSLGLVASVRLVNGMPGAVWEARVLRLSDSIDPTRQTLGIVVGVDNPYEKIIPGVRPPLLKGMYTAVDIFAPSHLALVIPRNAVHQGRVYIADQNNKLTIRDVEIQLIQSDLAIIQKGIKEGERVIITDIIPVIEGMPLSIITATEFANEMNQKAAGEQPELNQ